MAGSKRKASDDIAKVDGRAAAESQARRPPLGPISGPRSGTPNPGRPHCPPPGVAADGYFRRLYESEPDFRKLAKHDACFAPLYVLCWFFTPSSCSLPTRPFQVRWRSGNTR
jgi:hypothetical protein